jgi:hypothetical protein
MKLIPIHSQLTSYLKTNQVAELLNQTHKDNNTRSTCCPLKWAPDSLFQQVMSTPVPNASKE